MLYVDTDGRDVCGEGMRDKKEKDRGEGRDKEVLREIEGIKEMSSKEIMAIGNKGKC